MAQTVDRLAGRALAAIVIALALVLAFSVFAHAQKAKEPWEYLQEPAFNSAVLLYPPEKLVYGTVHEKGKATYLGDPPAAVATELPNLWKKEWRANQ